MDNKVMSILGYVAMGVGAVASIAGNIIGQKQQDAKIAEAATKAVTEVLNNKEG